MTTSTGDTFFNEVTFTGSIADASGLLYMNARYYNPPTARFLSQDTCTGSASVPWTQHLYAYCNNNPVNLVDPTGHAAERIHFGGDGFFPIWLYRSIHAAVQWEILRTGAYAIEKGVKFQNGGTGRIDVLEIATGSIWEIKHYNSNDPARTLRSARKQLNQYLTSTIIDESANIKQPFILGDQRFTNTQFAYISGITGKEYQVEFWSLAEGVIAYKFWETPNDGRKDKARGVWPRRSAEEKKDSIKSPNNIIPFPRDRQDKKSIGIAAAVLFGGLALGITFGGSDGYMYKDFGY